MQAKPLTAALLIAALAAIFLPSCGKRERSSGFTLGVLLPLTGESAAYGVDAREGVQLAAELSPLSEEIGLKLEFADSREEPKTTISAFRNLVATKEIDALLGSLFSITSLSLAPIAQQEGIVMLTPASSDEAVPLAGDKVFSLYPSATLEGELIAQGLIDDGVKSVSVLYQDVKAARDLAVAFSSLLTKNGIKILMEESLPSPEGYSSTVAKMGTPESVFICAYIDPMIQFMDKATELGLKTRWYAPSTLFEKGKVNQHAATLEGTVLAAPYFNELTEDPNTDAFRKAYYARFNREPSVWAAFAYDSCLALLQARADQGSGTLAASLANVEINGATGPTRFDKDGRAIKKMELLVVRNGGFSRR